MSEKLQVRQSIVVAAERERVWRAITRPDHFSKWFGMQITYTKLAVGETIIFSEGDWNDTGKIARVEPPEWYAFEWPADMDSEVNTLVTFYLEVVPGGEGTRITITEDGFEQLAEEVRVTRFKLNDKGWGIQVQNIADYLAQGKDTE
jgi:uncharacterized protein YndB with AHSA1/START domain